MMESETSYSTTEGKGEGSTDAVTATAGLYISAKFTKDGGFIETEDSISYVFTKEWAEQRTMEESISYSCPAGRDTVVLFSVPVETFYYNAYFPVLDDNGNILRYDKDIVTVNFPRTPAVKTVALEKYNAIARDYPSLPSAEGVLTSIPGDPATYPKSASGLKDAIVYGGNWAGVDYSERGGSITQEIAITDEHEVSVTHGYDIEFKLGGGGEVGLGKVWKMEISGGLVAGHGGEFGKVHTSSVGSSYSGTVFDLPAEAEPYGYYFAWKIFTYTAEVDGNKVPVVSYLVRDVTRPPELPDDFAQDYSLTTARSVGLTWSYPLSKSVAGFQIYRYYDFPEGAGSYEKKYVAAKDFVAVTYDEDGKAIRHYEYADEDLSPYTEYYYQIQAVRAVAPPLSIMGEPLRTRTKPERGIPEIELEGVEINEIPLYDQDGKPAGFEKDYRLKVYPDTVSSVSAVVRGQTAETPRYQWQKRGDEGCRSLPWNTCCARRDWCPSKRTAGPKR